MPLFLSFALWANFWKVLRKRVRGLSVITCARVLTLMAMCAVAATVLVSQGTPKAAASSSYSEFTYSYYMRNTNTSGAYTLGVNQCKVDKSGGHGSHVVMDWGRQYDSSGDTVDFSNTVVSRASILSMVWWYARGYWDCDNGSGTGTIAIGTSNYDGTSSSYGSAWGSLVSSARSSVSSSGWGSRVAVMGANDIEPGWSSASSAIAWANSFGSAGGGSYIDYGSADGCPESSYGNGSCNNGWNQYDVWYVAWGASPALVTPEIYYSANALQWTMISEYGEAYQGGMGILGPWEEHNLDTSTLTAQGAWSALYGDLTSHSSTTSVGNSMYMCEEIHYD